MKKILLLVLLFLCFTITGCKKEEDTFEHYDLENKDINTYIYHSDERGKEVYALADITPTTAESILTGLFYKIADKDYILLATLESSHTRAYKSKSTYQFYDNKLYGVGNGDTPTYFEIELEGKKSHIVEKKFTYNETYIGAASIDKIQNDYITFFGYTSLENEAMAGRNFKCYFKNYQCEIIDK